MLKVYINKIDEDQFEILIYKDNKLLKSRTITVHKPYEVLEKVEVMLKMEYDSDEIIK